MRGGKGKRVPDSMLAAFALVLVVEGMLPLLAPRVWRDSVRKIADLNDGQLRFIGLIAIVLGTIGYLLLAG